MEKNRLGYYINFNGNLTNGSVPVVNASNRSLRYGDGLFETMRWANGKIQLGSFHFERLFRGLGILQMEWPESFTPDYLSGQIHALCEKNNQDRARIRLNVFREESPAFFPVNNRLQFIIETADLPGADPEPLSVTIYSEEKKSTGILSNLKTNNYLLNVVAARYAKQNGFNDALILNAEDHLCEATSSNVFLIKGHEMYTPSLSEGCVAGVMRRHLLNYMPQLGFTVSETSITRDMILGMDEIFLTNAIRGIQPVVRLENREYALKLTRTLMGSLAVKLF